MLYRESGQFKTSYAKDQAIFPIAQDRIVVVALVVLGVVLPYFFADQYWLTQVLIPFAVFSMAAIGLNLLTGYCGQISLGTAAFMAVGAYASFKLTTAFPELNVVICFLIAGVITAAVGILFGLPSLRIKGFYLAVATLAAQFFLTWLSINSAGSPTTIRLGRSPCRNEPSSARSSPARKPNRKRNIWSARFW